MTDLCYTNRSLILQSDEYMYLTSYLNLSSIPINENRSLVMKGSNYLSIAIQPGLLHAPLRQQPSRQ